jgi:hypothetical protein
MLYGFKNPESFLKSVLLIMQPDFMLKKYHDRLSATYTVRTEMSLKLATYYRKYDYKKQKMDKTVMIEKLQGKETYNSLDFQIFTADYFNVNLLIIDIQHGNYLEIPTLVGGTECIILVKHINNTYLPLIPRPNQLTPPPSMNEIAIIIRQIVKPDVECGGKVMRYGRVVDANATLEILQEYAIKTMKIDIYKIGKTGKKVHKTRGELVTEMGLQ